MTSTQSELAETLPQEFFQELEINTTDVNLGSENNPSTVEGVLAGSKNELTNLPEEDTAALLLFIVGYFERKVQDANYLRNGASSEMVTFFNETIAHSKQVAEILVLFYKELGYSDNVLRYIRVGALTHDLGKFFPAVADALQVRGKLEPEQLVYKHAHPVLSAVEIKKILNESQITVTSELRNLMLRFARYHHISYSYKNTDFASLSHSNTKVGYPYSIEWHQVSFLIRWANFFDSYSGIRQKRVYKQGRSHEETMRIIGDTEFPPAYREIFIQFYTENSQAIEKIFEQESD